MMTSCPKNLSIDIETFSSKSITSGVSVYAGAPDFEVLLVSYAFDDGEVVCIDLASGEKLPEEFIKALSDKTIIKWAFNSIFERTCLGRYLNTNFDPVSWKDTMIWASYLGINGSLKIVGAVLKLEHQKLEEGKALIKYFCLPCEPTIANGGRTRNLPKHDPAKWDLFKTYNIRDTEVERSIRYRFAKFPVPEFIWEEFYEDQRINDRGVLIDVPFVKNAIEIEAKFQSEKLQKMKEITNLENPNSLKQLKEYLNDKGLPVDTLGKKDLKAYKEQSSNDEIGEILKLREETSLTSNKKYQKMLDSIDKDNRARGLFAFYNCKTGRWASHRIQLQNMKRNSMPDLEEARDLVKQNNVEMLSMLYEDVPETISQLVRTSFIPKLGCKFIVCDFSSIEARVLAWLSGEKWRIDSFEKGEDLYCRSASMMFGVKVEKHGENSELRQKGKIAELALGYGGSVNSLISMGALDMGLDEYELREIVDKWRAASPSITKYWKDIGRATKKAIKDRCFVKIGLITIRYKSGMLFIDLPSGRSIVYVSPKVMIGENGYDEISYNGIYAGKWVKIKTHGGKLVENIVQAIARDLLSNAIMNLKEYDIVMHIHDEVVIECPIETKIESITSQMNKAPSWAKGLILKSDAYETQFYKKD